MHFSSQDVVIVRRVGLFALLGACRARFFSKEAPVNFGGVFLVLKSNLPLSSVLVFGWPLASRTNTNAAICPQTYVRRTYVQVQASSGKVQHQWGMTLRVTLEVLL